MQPLLLLQGNPKKRRGGKRRRSAAQRAATERMLAANRTRSNPARKSRKRKASTATASPVARKRRSTARRTARRVSQSSGDFGMANTGRGVLGLVKTGAIGGGGAVLTDVAMGFVAQQFPTQTQFTNRLAADGSINPLYYAAKGAIAYGIGRFGTRVTRHAPAMAAGAYTVMLYEIIKSLIPAGSMPLGYFNPARIVRGGVGRVAGSGSSGVGRILPMNGVGRILPLPTGGDSPGTVAARAIRMAGSR